ncbi:alpha/beta hydrolase [Amycolatopsis panacis]|uniref:Alpha/beta hydrolase n=1 Tax=Amycolatopsis panacis TaxID=2340917 RepID=A0A419HVF1_9PSEU|nr:alpha/beta hydrolase [Amycolatopsis panacis]RJQ80876.1 alpha/beta hydrolase [Amycolatopsis panacis]
MKRELCVLGGVLLAVVQTVSAGPAQKISWHHCATDAALDAVGARCGEVRVPLNYAEPGGRKITVALARRPASDPARRIGTLVVEEGGPGPSRQGVGTLVRQAPEIAARYDLVGIDPRFFGSSTPLDCGWPTGEYVSLAQAAPADRASFDRTVSAAKALAARCASHRDVLPYAGTRSIARDLDVVRAALGEERISYLGWSYGTYLGAVYTQMFPDRTDRVVLDSAIAPNAYGPALTRETAPADAAALRDWAAWASHHNGQYDLGATAAAVVRTVLDIQRAAARRPLEVGEHRITADRIPGLLLTSEDTDESYAELGAQVRMLRDVARGLPAQPTAVQQEKLALYTDTTVTRDFWFSASAANACADRAASRDPETYYADIRAHAATEPFYGPLARHLTACTFWPVAPPEPPTRIGNDRSVLIVGATGDPVTPYPGQQELHRALRGSRMVTLASAFRHGVYGYASSACVTDAVGEYLLGGVLPAVDRFC